MRLSTKILGAAAVVANLAAAHPGEKHSAEEIQREILARDNAADIGARALNTCSGSAASQAMKKRSVERRAETVKKLRERKGLKSTKDKRNLAALEAWEKVNHNMTGTDNFDMFTDIESVFGADTSCVLAPENTGGPYYVVGEYMRSNVKEASFSEGVDVFLEVQYVDTNTCEGVPRIATDLWNCNATGVYSGVESGQAGLDTTFLRGIQMTDHDGVVQYETIFPGHYEGRATHTHLLSHMNATIMPNGTIAVWNAPVTHIGQLFWPEDLITEVEATSPYNTNTGVERTTNDDDMWAPVAASSAYDPFPKFVYLGDDITDGIFAWIQIGVNASANYISDDYYSVAAYLDAEGGHSSGSSSTPGGGGDGGPPSNSTSS